MIARYHSTGCIRVTTAICAIICLARCVSAVKIWLLTSGFHLLFFVRISADGKWKFFYIQTAAQILPQPKHALNANQSLFNKVVRIEQEQEKYQMQAKHAAKHATKMNNLYYNVPSDRLTLLNNATAL